MRARAAWGVVALTTIAVILDTVFTAAYRPLLSEATWADHGWPLAPLAGLGCALMGALIVSRHPKHLLGWLLCGCQPALGDAGRRRVHASGCSRVTAPVRRTGPT